MAMLSRREQLWAVHELVESGELGVDLGELDEGWQGIARELVEMRGSGNGNREYRLLDLLSQRDGGREAYDRVMKAVRPGKIEFPSYADLDLPPVEWCWYPWLPNGLVTLLAAPPGAGKSTIALEFARRIVHGLTAPDGSAFTVRSNRVLHVDAEDQPRSTASKGRAWGMDLSQIYPMLPAEYGALNLESIEDRDRILEMAHSIEPGLVIVDSFSRVTARGDSSVDEVRPVLAFLKGLAQDLDCALLLIHHMRKMQQNQLPGFEITLNEVRGSGDIAAAARAIWVVTVPRIGPETDLNGPRKLSMVKSNIGPIPEPLGARWEQVKAGPGVQQTEVRVVWGDAPEEWEEPTEADKCKEWLVAYLESTGPTRPMQIVEDAEDAGYGRATVYRARRQLGERVANTKGARSPQNEWELVGGSGV